MRKRALLALFAILGLAAASLAEDGLRELAPSWTPGLEWTVLAHPLVFSAPKDARSPEKLARDPKKTFKVKFQVKGKKDVGGVACHEVLLTSDQTPDDEIYLLVRQQDLSLKEVRKHNKTSGTDTRISNERTPFVLLEQSTLAPLDFPLFPRETRSEEKTFDLGEGRKVAQKVTVSKEKAGGFEVELETTWRGKKLVVKQTWKKGLPFWSKSVRTLDGVEDETATLEDK